MTGTNIHLGTFLSLMTEHKADCKHDTSTFYGVVDGRSLQSHF